MPLRAAPLTPLAPRAVTVDDPFWSPLQALVRTRTLPQQEHHLRTGGQFEALRLRWRPGDPGEPHIFWESDVAKWIEAASHVLETSPDAHLEASVDEAIALLAGAQQPDGYLNVYFTVVAPGQRFTDLHAAHELYCLGHLVEAAVAHHRATGRTSLLDVVRRYVDLVDREFAVGGPREGGYCGHPEIELALVALARATGEPRYRDLARRMLAWRGTEPWYFAQELARRGRPGYFGPIGTADPETLRRSREYNQSHAPVREQHEAVGHSVRAMYLYCAMADLAVDDTDADLFAVCERLWRSTTGTKAYVTGGLGADPSIEGFRGAYELPDVGAYAETCAAIGLVMWARRMLNATGDGRYGDVLETALYNGVLAGMSADGTSYFYANPLASDGHETRSPWFGVACCPPNLARLVTAVQQYAYADDEHELAVHLYLSGEVRTRAGGGAQVQVGADYPRSGDVTCTVHPHRPGTAWTLSLRVPAWAHGATVEVPGATAVPVAPTPDGYVHLHRAWADGDVVRLHLPLSPRRVWADPRVGACVGRVALARGPLVHCLEGVDHDGPVQDLVLPRDAVLREEPGADGAAVVIVADGAALTTPHGADALYRGTPPDSRPARIRAVPYSGWGNRGATSMRVWIRETV